MKTLEVSTKGLGLRRVLVVTLLLVGLVLAGCGESPLSHLGEASGEWISAPGTPAPTTTSTVPGSQAVNLYRAGADAEITWVNDELGDPVSTHPADTIAGVWSRSNHQDRYVQASRSEIAAALPGLEFPELVPVNVAYITSQLVFEPATGHLSDDAIAAFGFWSAEPYSKSRSVAQLAVLMVSPDPTPTETVVPDTIGLPDDPPEDTRCDDLVGSTVERCVPMTLENGEPAWSLQVSSGWRLVWESHGYEYDLFVRNAGNTDVLARMAASVEDLASPLIAVDGVAGEPAATELADRSGEAGS